MTDPNFAAPPMAQPYLTPAPPAAAAAPAIVSGLSGNELYCIDLLGYRTGDFVLGTSVYARGLIGGFISGWQSNVGGEMTPLTDMLQQGRAGALTRLIQEAQQKGAHGVTGTSVGIHFRSDHIEFEAAGTVVYQKEGVPQYMFTTASGGQDLYCEIDAGHIPISFVMGNSVYSMGAIGGLGALFRGLARGGVAAYSQNLNAARDAALQRVVAEARQVGANSIVGLRTFVTDLHGGIENTAPVVEMNLVGTASRQQAPLDASVIANGGVATSNLTAEELWNVARLGYTPIQLVMSSTVYSMGAVGGITSWGRQFAQGELPEMTQLFYDARNENIGKIQLVATRLGASEVIGAETFINHLGNNIVEFFTIGTAAKREGGLSTVHDALPPQALTRDRDTYFY